MPITRRPARLLALVPAVVLLGACGGPSGSIPPASPPPSPSPTAVDVGIDHPTGATDLILRLEEGGGFVPVEFLAAGAPVFSFYGDGTAIYRDATAAGPEIGDGFAHGAPFTMARLPEARIQELLGFAITQGGLGVARERYDNMQVADAGTSTFTIQAGGTTKTVEVYALGMDSDAGPDAAIRRAFETLAERLRSFDDDGLVTAAYEPGAYRGTLIESGGFGNVRDWPWPDFGPDAFKPLGDPNAPGFPRRAMSLDEIAEVGVSGFEGGLQGLQFEGPDGKIYSFTLRPLLPDESD